MTGAILRKRQMDYMNGNIPATSFKERPRTSRAQHLPMQKGNVRGQTMGLCAIPFMLVPRPAAFACHQLLHSNTKRKGDGREFATIVLEHRCNTVLLGRTAFDFQESLMTLSYEDEE